MKILVVAPRFHTNLYHSLMALQNKGHKVKVAVLYKGKSEYYENVDLIQFPLSAVSAFFSKALGIFKKNQLKTDLELRLEAPNKELNYLIKKFKPDVVLLKAYQNLLAISTIWRLRNKNIKVFQLLQTNKDNLFGSRQLLKLTLFICKFTGMKGYITPIKISYDLFKNLGIDSIYYLPFVFPAIEEIKPKNYSIIRILSIGKIVKRKDHLILIKTIKNLIDKGFKLQLSIFGEPADKTYLMEINLFINENNLGENVKINFESNYEALINQYLLHDIFVLPAFDEPASYSPVEALAHGVPVICSDSNGTACYIENGYNGYIFKAKNETDLMDKMEMLIADKSKLLKLSQNALISAKKNFRPANFHSSLMEIINLR